MSTKRTVKRAPKWSVIPGMPEVIDRSWCSRVGACGQERDVFAKFKSGSVAFNRTNVRRLARMRQVSFRLRWLIYRITQNYEWWNRSLLEDTRATAATLERIHIELLKVDQKTRDMASVGNFKKSAELFIKTLDKLARKYAPRRNARKPRKVVE